MKIKKTFLIINLLIAFVLIFSLSPRVKALDADELYQNIKDGVDTFDSTGANKVAGIGMDASILDVVYSVAGIIYGIGCVIVVGGTFYLAYQYGKSNPVDKASAKSKLIGWLITSVIMIGAIPIWKTIVSLFSDD